MCRCTLICLSVLAPVFWLLLISDFAWRQDAVGAAVDSEVIFQLDFGPPKTVETGYTAVLSDEFQPRQPYIWKGIGLGYRDRGGESLLKRDFIFGNESEFIVGLDNGEYEVALIMGDKDYAHGPFDIVAEGVVIFKGVVLAKGKFIEERFNVKIADEKLNLRFAVIAPLNFVVNAMTIRGSKQNGDHALVEDAPTKEIPTAEQIDGLTPNVDARKALESYCEWLVERQQPSGAWSSSWYQNSYPVRTLIAGYDILGKQEYLDAALRCLDKLPPEQLPNGSWSAGFRNKPSAKSSKAELDRIMAGTTNTADVGCIAACLSIAYSYVDETRKKLYLAAAKRYADEYASKWQLASGGFTNARCGGIDCNSEYSVATGTQAMNFAALYAVTGEERYLEIASRAVGFQLDNWLEDGRPIHFRWNSKATVTHNVTSFGDIYYYHDGIMWVYHYTKDPALKAKIKEVYSWHIKGSKGLLQARVNGVWWPIAHGWTNAKACAMPSVFMLYCNEMDDDPEALRAVKRCVTFLSTPRYAEKVGVMVDERLAWGKYSMQATGFAGLSLAEHLKPGVVFLKGKAVRAK